MRFGCGRAHRSFQRLRNLGEAGLFLRQRFQLAHVLLGHFGSFFENRASSTAKLFSNTPTSSADCGTSGFMASSAVRISGGSDARVTYRLDYPFPWRTPWYAGSLF